MTSNGSDHPTTNRLGTKSIGGLRRLLTERDLAILQSVSDHKFLTTRQICALHFWNHASHVSGIRACTRVLNRLREHRFIYRLERPVGGHGGGSTSYVWGIAAAGDRLLKADIDLEEKKRSRPFEPTVLFLAHTLAIADTRLVLEELNRAGDIELLTVTTEPNNWRPFLDRTGAPSILKPDLYAVTAHGDYEDSWFIEVDRGTESIPTLIRKSELYQRYHATGIEQDARDVFPLVLWIVPTATRRNRLTQTIEDDRRLDAALFKVITPAELTSTVTGDNNPTPITKGGTHL